MEEHPEARYIVETLAEAGFIAYYAGGWVRDLLLQLPSDDIDIATNAPPETIQALFPHTVPIGIAFGIILVIIDGKQYEVATFRQDLDYKDGRRPSRVAFTTAIEDARRRDFTINGMFYDPLQNEVIDYVEGRKDLAAGVIRAIGNPHERIKEDRLRMIRALRLACRFHFHIESHTEQAIRAHATELFPAVAIERIWQEFTKSHAFGKLHPFLLKLHSFGLLETIFPTLASLSLSEVEHRLSPLPHYPLGAPVIAWVLPLFPHLSLPGQLELCKQLKLSNQDMQFVAFLHHAKTLLNHPAELADWAHFYANEYSTIALQIMSAPLPTRADFLSLHHEQRAVLQNSIQRIQTRNPVITSEYLLHAGIKPGKTMGQLLKEAERISINKQIFDPAAIWKILEKKKHSE